MLSIQKGKLDSKNLLNVKSDFRSGVNCLELRELNESNMER